MDQSIITYFKICDQINFAVYHPINKHKQDANVIFGKQIDLLFDLVSGEYKPAETIIGGGKKLKNKVLII